MLQEKINACRIRMDNVNTNRNKIAESSTIVKANNTFFDSLDKLEQYLKFYLLALGKFEINFSESVTSQVKECIEICKYNFERNSVKNAESFRGKTNALCTAIQNEWSQYAANKDDNLIERMTILKTVSRNQKQIQEAIAAISIIKFGVLTNERYQTYLVGKQEAEKMLVDVHFDAEIEKFLKKVSDKEATLLDLNDTILQWIKEEKLEKSIALSIKLN